MSDFDINCSRCTRLANFLKEVKQEYNDYYCRPVPPFGDPNAHLLVVGLAPGKHGANATGRPFTGDHAGLLLYQTLYEHGFATSPVSASANDSLKLLNCRITNAVKCLPPGNKPVGEEVRNCNRFLAGEIAGLASNSIIIALGTLAHGAVLRAMSLTGVRFPFKHGIIYKLSTKFSLIDSYHCSRYNTNTGRLTEKMFNQVFEKAKKQLKKND